MIAGSSFGGLISSIGFWDGVGRLVIDVLLIGVLFFVVMTVAGHEPAVWPFHHRTSSLRRAKPAGETKDSAEGMSSIHASPPAARERSSDPHLDFLASLRTSFQYQGTTVVLIVFAVILLGIQRILGATEIATILSGIAGFVLGQNKSQSELAAAKGGDGGSGGTPQERSAPGGSPGASTETSATVRSAGTGERPSRRPAPSRASGPPPP
jgi:hypothetical protein